MFKSKCLKNAAAAGFLVLLVLATGLQAASVAKPEADQLLKMIPAETLFCIRVNHFDYTLSQIDQFLAGVSPVPMGSSILVRMQLARVMGSPQLNGVNMNGSFVVFGAILPGETKPNPPSNIFIGGLVPVTNYRQLIIGNPNISQPDEKGVSKITIKGKPVVLITQVGNYALVSPPNDYNKLVATAKVMSTQKAGLAGALDSDEAKLAAAEPVWIYGNVQQASKTFGPLVSAKIEEFKTTIKNETRGPKAPPMMNVENIINMYVSIIETLMRETKSVSITINPKPNVLNITETISAVPGTDMAKMFVADASAKQKNNLLGYLEDGAMMNVAFKTNTPFMKELNVKRFDLLEVIAGRNMTAEDIAKWKKMAANMVKPLGGPAAFSVMIDPNNKPPFEIKYLIDVKNPDKFNKLTEDAIKMMNASGIMDMYKGMGLEMNFEISRGCGCYKGVLIDSAKLEIKSTEPNSPQAQIMNLMFGDGFNYRWAVVDRLFVCAVSSDADSAIRKMIDQVKAGGPKQMPDEMKAALTLLPQADKADFVATYNYLRLFKMIGAIMPMPIPQMNIPTKSNIVLAGKIGNGKLVVDIALPKEHLMETVGFFMKIQQQQQEIMKQKQPGIPRSRKVAPVKPLAPTAGKDARFAIPKKNLQIPEEMQACTANFRKIQAAIRKYKKDKGELPNWLSDLVPDYITNDALLCPNDPRHKAKYSPDPKLPCSYAWEFSSARIPAGRDPTRRTRYRDWKTQQLKLFGDIVPMVRCNHHGSNRVLNLSTGGQIYWGKLNWEETFKSDYRFGDESRSRPLGRAGAVTDVEPSHGKLDLSGPQTTDADLARRLEGLTSLGELRLQGTNITDAGLAHLKGLTSLELLFLGATGTTDAGLGHIENLTALKNLCVHKTQVTDAGLAHLKGLTSLESLCLHDTQVTDAGLAHLQGLTSLETLYLHNTKVSDAGLVHLKSLTSLRRLNLIGTKISSAGLTQLKQALPNCSISGPRPSTTVPAKPQRTIQPPPEKASAPRTRQLIGKPAPAFTLKDLNGKQVRLSDFKGKVVLLDFWATWCGPCVRAIPHMEALHKKYKDQGLVVIGINHERDHAKVKNFAKERMSYIVLLDADEQFKKYGVRGIPTAFYIDRKGKIRHQDVGFGPGKEKQMEQKVKELISK